MTNGLTERSADMSASERRSLSGMGAIREGPPTVGDLAGLEVFIAGLLKRKSWMLWAAPLISLTGLLLTAFSS